MRAILLFMVLFLAACTGKPGFNDASLSDREFQLEEFFEGDLVAYGHFQDVLGTVRRRFEVKLNGTWDGTNLRLQEDFVYEDGETERRIWVFTKTGPDTWDGRADGVKGVAKGIENGDRFNFRYTIDLPVGDGETVRLSFNDWLWQVSEDRVLNKAYVKRFGVDVGELIIWFEKL
ncbi:DUF3833 family protein [Litoreibacter roseus]|uniref:DUF3833 domain-containing protein n=1 Tax=Litoreibacter roseus TaxID=2601869 RepID=A0A6N6JIP8_9RHOB|nr:DUF3833 family protein [Litoreibacter roseus]GFE65158.1 hypothetical protein KIN_22320 [Litoreibacter roseus]